MKEYLDVISFLFFVPLGVFFVIMVAQALRKKPSNVSSALRDSVNRFS